MKELKAIMMWKLLFSIAFVILLSIFVKADIKEYIVWCCFIFGSSLVFVEESVMKKTIDIINNEEFTKKFSFFYKCFLVSISLSIFSSLIVVTSVYENAEDTPTSLIAFSFLISFMYFFYFLRFKRKKTLPFCG